MQDTPGRGRGVPEPLSRRIAKCRPVAVRMSQRTAHHSTLFANNSLIARQAIRRPRLRPLVLRPNSLPPSSLVQHGCLWQSQQGSRLPQTQSRQALTKRQPSPRSRYRQIQIRRGHLFGQQDNLPHVLLHMSYHLVDRLQHTHIPPLWRNPLHQSLWRHPRNHALRLVKRRPEQRDQLLCAHPTLGTELRIPHPDIGRATYPMYHPLPRIPTEV
jgi:hypothetical protein